MRLMTVFLMIGLGICQAETSYSQTTMLSLSMNNRTIKEVFTAIEKQSEYVFFYYDNAINVNRKVNINVRKQPINKILDELFESTDNTYYINNRQIIISRREENKTSSPKMRPESLLPQQRNGKNIRGVVLDEKGEPIIGANILVKGTSQGVITDVNGKFDVKVPSEGSVLVISYIGYQTVEIKVGNRNDLKVNLMDDTEQLAEVVVVGYGVQKKESVVGAITQVGGKSLTETGNSDVTGAIAGKLSGVLTMQTTGLPGKTQSDILIRGVSSWNGSSPLVMVDGVERDFSDLDPNEVNTISVLKDASATAVFGAKGANGVILVTTKRGVESKPQFDVSASYGMQTPTWTPKFIDGYQTMSMWNVAEKNGRSFSKVVSDDILQEYRHPSTRLNSLRYPNVDWFDLLTRDFAPVTNANFNLRGGTNFVKYFCSLGYYHQGSIFDGFDDGGYCDTHYKYNRFNYRTNLDFNLTKTTTLSLNIGGDISTTSGNSQGNIWWYLYCASACNYPAYYPAWALEEVPDTDYPDASGKRLALAQGEKIYNPYSYLYQGTFNEYTASKLFTDLQLSQDLGFITKGLSAKAKVSFNTYYRNQSLTASWTFPEYTLMFDNIGTSLNPWVRDGEGNETWIQSPLDINVGGLQGDYYKDLYYEASLNYDRSFGKHSVTGLFLFNRHQNDPNTEYSYYNESWVGRATYDYAKKYLLEFNVGYTGSERFAPANRFGFFPSAAVGWVASEEPFIKKNAPWLSLLKFRYSDGLVGSDYASSRWLYMSDYSTSSNIIYEDAVANKDAQWEEAHKRDLGIETGFLDNMFTFSADFFDEHRSKMLLDVQSNTFLIGNNGFKQLNRGKMKKHGYELELGFNKQTAYGLNYKLKGMFSFNENRIVFKDDYPYVPNYQKISGTAQGAKTGGSVSVDGGYYTSVDDIHNYPTTGGRSLNYIVPGDYKYLDFTSDGILSSLDSYPVKGSLYAPYSYSLSGEFTYRNWEASILFQGVQGKYINFRGTFQGEFNSDAKRVHEAQVNYWTPTNRNADHATMNDPEIWGGYGSGALYGQQWRKSDYLRLKQIYVGYSFKPKFLVNTINVSKVTVYASGNNVFTLTNLVEGDPEQLDMSTDTSNAYGTYNYYPLMATYKLGIKIIF